MPRTTTPRIISRKDDIYRLLSTRGELPTAEIVRAMGLTHSQVFYILRLLVREGKVKEIKRGKVAYWKVIQ
ncbi:MAG: DNA-binding protein [Thermoprotei archaeon]|nr:MAG: DNA-binding protein [Thermoprotei archaeon]RLE87531.1 MAG: DNA-binding protein [Thermoprotei archaeon]